MFRIIPADQFLTSSWQNGGGVTHEIARDGPEWAWRLSIAEVDSDGSFSVFPQMARILTVLDGAGIDLWHDAGVIPARPFLPVYFSGEIAIDCRRLDGNIRDFNVIYDPTRFCADVEVLTAGTYVTVRALTGILAVQDGVMAAGEPVPLGGFALGHGAVEVEGRAIRVLITPR